MGDVTFNARFAKWLRREAQQGLDVLVVGGCTTTSCVRVSSQEIVRLLQRERLDQQVHVVVDLNLCGARRDNYEKNAEQDPVLVHAYGRDVCVGKSAVELAVVQMRQAGVEVI